MAKLFKTAFAYQGTKEQLPDSAQPDGKASFAEGFTVDYTLDYGDADARDIAQSELNGIFHDITEAIGELQQYGVAVWQAGMTPIAKYSLVFHDGKLWQAKKNTSATPAAGADWQQVDIADIASQLASIDLSNYATKTYADGLVAGLASKSYVDLGLATKATASVVNAQLAGKFDKTDVVQESGQSTTKVMSQKAVTDAISGAAAGQLKWGAITGDIENQADLKAALDAKLTKTFTPWQPEVIEGTGIDLPNVIDMFGSSDPITLTGSTVRMERTGFPSAQDAYLTNGLKSDSFSFGDTTSLYYKVKSSLDVEAVRSPIYVGFSNSAFDSWASANASISGGTLSLESIGEFMGEGDITEFNPPIEVLVTDDSEYCVSYDKTLNKVSFFVDGVEIASHAFSTDFGFDVVTGSVAVDSSNYQGDPSTLTLWGETEFLSSPAHPIAGLEPLIIGAGGSTIDETKYPENPQGKGYEIVGLAKPAQWDALGKEVKNGDLIVFNDDGLPVLMNEEPTVVQETGNSETAVMSQKAVTDELDNKVDKIQAKEILTANKILTAADSGKLLIINADGITITLPASSEFNIDIAKMDEDFITIVECSGTDKFREGSTSISVIRDVSITNSGIVGKEWLAIGAYEA
jgi:hypothetical protein